MIIKISLIVAALGLGSIVYFSYTRPMQTGGDEFEKARAAMVENQLKARAHIVSMVVM